LNHILINYVSITHPKDPHAFKLIAGIGVCRYLYYFTKNFCSTTFTTESNTVKIANTGSETIKYNNI
jgi:hypothetical protein